ncbi:MAG: hypothetical protein OXU20_15975 [Myxococcales bacterium]|nr:hypothetical protein [Myxococcales bacterium]
MAPRLSRRHVLIGLGGLGAGAAAGTSWAVFGDPSGAVLAFLREVLPGVKLDEASVQTCLRDFTANWSRGKKLAIGTAWRALGVRNTAALHARMEKLERLLLTFFLVNSNFFRVRDPRAETIVYYSRPVGAPCASPFTDFSPPA